jgi:ABC-type uncharacterized transport system involved in gliding motility auxiliary subunit
MRTVEKDQAAVSMVYSGILIQYLGRSSVIPWAFSTSSLEYDLTSRIRALIKNQTKEVGFILGDSGKTLKDDYSFMQQAIENAGVKTREIKPGDEIPDTLTALIVLGGADSFDDWDLYRIDRFIQMGGKVLFCTDGVKVDISAGLTAKKIDDKGLLAMLKDYGVTVEPNLVEDVSCNTLQYNQPLGPNSYALQFMRYPYWVSALPQGGNPDHSLTANFAGLDLFWPSELTLKEGVSSKGQGASKEDDKAQSSLSPKPLALSPELTATPLIYSTPKSWLNKGDSYNIGLNQQYAYTSGQKDTQGKKVLAAAVAGVFPSYFAGKAKPTREGSKDTLPDMPAKAVASRILVVGDSWFASNMIQQTNSQRNLDFLVSCVDWLGNDDDIIAIKSRDSGPGKLDKITDEASRARAFAVVRIINLGVVPAIVIVLGILMTVMRRQRMKAAVGAAPDESAEKTKKTEKKAKKEDSNE